MLRGTNFNGILWVPNVHGANGISTKFERLKEKLTTGQKVGGGTSP